MQGSAEYKIHVNPAGGGVVLTPGDPLNPTQLSDEQVGVEMTPLEIVASGGQSPYQFAISAGALPDGIVAASNNVDTLQLSGTPTTAEDADFTITAVDANGAPAKTAFKTRVIK